MGVGGRGREVESGGVCLCSIEQVGRYTININIIYVGWNVGEGNRKVISVL